MARRQVSGHRSESHDRWADEAVHHTSRRSVIRRWLVSIALLASGAAHAGPEARPDARPAAAPPPDGTGEVARPAVVDKRRIIGILEVRVDGVPDDIRESFQKGIEEKFDAARYRLANRARV